MHEVISHSITISVLANKFFISVFFLSEWNDIVFGNGM